MEMERIIWSDKRLYTIGNISEELIFSFFIDCIYIIFYKRVVTALYSFLFNKHVIFYYIFLKQNFSFSLKVSVYKLLTNFICVLLLFAWMVFMLLISSSQIMVDQAVQLPSHNKLLLSSHPLGFDDCIFNLLGLLFEVFQ